MFTKINSGYFFAVAALFLWSWNVIISRYLAPFIPPFQISFGRWFFAGIFVLPFAFKSIIRERTVLGHSWKIILALSVGLAFMNNFIYQAGHSTSAINMSLLATTGPIFMILFSWLFFKSIITKGQALGFSVAFVGVLTVISGGHIETFTALKFNAGNLWMIIFAIFFGLYGALEKKQPREVSQFTLLAVTIFVGILLLLPFFLATLAQNPLSNITLFQWGLILYLGIVNSIFAYLFWNIALRKLGSIRTSIIYYAIPLFSTTEAYFILDEKMGFGELIGAAFVLCGILIANMYKTSTSSPSH